MTCRVRDGRIEAEIIIDFEPLEIIPLMRTKLHYDVEGKTKTRLYARSVAAIGAARKAREQYLTQVRDGDICDTENP